MPPMPPEDDNDNPELDGPAPTPSEMEAPEAAEPQGEVCLPLDALGMPDEQDQMETPVAGDKGQSNIEWTLLRSEGNKGYVTIDAVNGKPIEKAKAPSDEEEMGQLQQMAANMPPRQ